jgi:uncharacterized membrane protein (DUF485 family)
VNNAGIFAFGVFVMTFVIAACWLIAWGIVTERRDRHRLEDTQRKTAAA